jgi:hypothetical protein
MSLTLQSTVKLNMGTLSSRRPFLRYIAHRCIMATGAGMPVLGLGVGRSVDAENSALIALKHGYRHIELVSK